MSATTTMPVEIGTTALTPGAAFAFSAFMLATCAPKAGDRTTTPVSMPGSVTSMPKMASAFTFSGVSRRFTGCPMILNAFGSLSLTSAGTGSFMACAASSP